MYRVTLTRLTFAVLIIIGLGCGASPWPSGDAQAQLPKADRLVVYKAKRTMHVLHNGWIVRSYAIRLGDNPKGQKIFQHDGRTPEGRYLIDGRNAKSRFHLSLHIDYPKAEHVARAAKYGTSAGGEIFIHGTPGKGGRYDGDWTNGCIAILNHEIDELWHAVDDGTPIEIKP